MASGSLCMSSQGCRNLSRVHRDPQVLWAKDTSLFSSDGTSRVSLWELCVSRPTSPDPWMSLSVLPQPGALLGSADDPGQGEGGAAGCPSSSSSSSSSCLRRNARGSCARGRKSKVRSPPQPPHQDSGKTPRGPPNSRSWSTFKHNS